MPSDSLDPTAISAGLSPSALPRTIRCYATVGSTMDLARELLATLDNSQLPALVVADEQVTGRGRLGRPWVAPPGSALLASLALRPSWLPPQQGVALVWMTAVALCEAVETVTALRPGLKWPNDLLVTPPHQSTWAKAAGILLEVHLGEAGIEWAILGCGVNINASPPPEATRYPSTNLTVAAGADVSRLAILRALLEHLGTWHMRLRSGERDALFTAWRSRLVTLGQPVSVELPTGKLEGLAVDVDADGSLLVRDATERLHIVTAGDVGVAP